MLGRRLYYVEWLELFWRAVLIALLVWFAYAIRDLVRLRQVDAAHQVAVSAVAGVRHAEMIRLLRAICLSTTTVYDANRGVCDPSSSTSLDVPKLPRLKGGPYK